MTQSLNFNPDELAKRYDLEKAKRLRKDGASQYQDLEGSLAHLKTDAFADPNFGRDPIEKDVGVLVVGGGLGGLLVAVQLIEKGVQDLCIVEKGGSYGGTWYWNQYPGVRCDIESYIYIPLLEEMGYVPTEKYATGIEILKHVNNIVEKWNLRSKTQFQTEVKTMTWDDENSYWIVKTDRKDTFHARYIVTATGILHKPKLPRIPGITSFKGQYFHTSRWDYDYTGGRDDWKLTGLKDKRVAIVGTGATSIQIVPILAKYCKHLYVIQRTPSSISVRNNHPTDLEFSSNIKPGWQIARMENFNAVLSGGKVNEDLVNDGWTKMQFMAPPDEETASLSFEDQLKKLELADFQKMERIRARVDEIVTHKATAEKLKPWYHTLCKRPCFHDEYLQTFNSPNCTLVDTDGKGVDKITENAIVVGGKAYEVDLIIYSTGFETPARALDQNDIQIKGKGGKFLSEKINTAAATLYGIQTRDFPNYFQISALQSGITVNFSYTLVTASKQIAYVISQCEKDHVKSVEPTAEAEENWVRKIMSGYTAVQVMMANCTPGYYNNEGHPTQAMARFGVYPSGATAWARLLEEWRDQGGMVGLEVIKK